MINFKNKNPFRELNDRGVFNNKYICVVLFNGSLKSVDNVAEYMHPRFVWLNDDDKNNPMLEVRFSIKDKESVFISVGNYIIKNKDTRKISISDTNPFIFCKDEYEFNIVNMIEE